MSLIKNAWGEFYHEYEGYSQERREELIRKRLGQIISLAKGKTTFYKDRLEAFSPSAEFPLADVRPLSSTDTRSEIPPQGSGLMTVPLEDLTVFQSGGTTGTPKTTLFSFEEMEHINQCNARGFYACGLKSQDKVGNFWAVGGLYMTFVHMNRMLMEYGCLNFPFSNHTPSEFVANVAELFKINCFSGIASVVLNTLREIRDQKGGDIGFNVDTIFYGGEHLYPADRIELKNNYGTKNILAPGYGTVDTWYEGYQCSQCAPGVFHAHDDQCYLEIVDEETGKHCPPGEIGMVYATPLVRKATPVIRYRVGDRARWIKDSCPCGRTTPLFELLGRGDDVLRIGYDSVDYNFVQELAAGISGLSGSVQMQKYRRGGKDELVIRIESEEKEEAYQSLKLEFEAAFCQMRPSFNEFVKKGTVCPLKVEVCKLSSLGRNERTGKLIRVIDCI